MNFYEDSNSDQIYCGEALYHGKLWNAGALKPDGINYDAALWKKMKMESQARQFFCPECGENLILCAGKIVAPYFKHYEGSECIYSDAGSYGKAYRTRSCLYGLVRRSFPDAQIEQYASVPGSRFRSQLLVRTLQFTMAVNYVPDNCRLKKLEEKRTAIEENGYIPVWFCEYRPGQFEKNSVVQNLILETQPVLKFVDFANDTLYLKKELKRGRPQAMLCEAYPLEKMRLNRAGEFPEGFREQGNQVMLNPAEHERIKELEYGRKLYELLKKNGYLSSTAAGFYYEEEILIEEIIKETAESERRTETESPTGPVLMLRHGQRWFLPRIKGEYNRRNQAYQMRRALLKYVDSVMELDTAAAREAVFFAVRSREAERWLEITEE